MTKAEYTKAKKHAKSMRDKLKPLTLRNGSATLWMEFRYWDKEYKRLRLESVMYEIPVA